MPPSTELLKSTYAPDALKVKPKATISVEKEEISQSTSNTSTATVDNCEQVDPSDDSDFSPPSEDESLSSEDEHMSDIAHEDDDPELVAGKEIEEVFEDTEAYQQYLKWKELHTQNVEEYTQSITSNSVRVVTSVGTASQHEVSDNNQSDSQ